MKKTKKLMYSAALASLCSVAFAAEDVNVNLQPLPMPGIPVNQRNRTTSGYYDSSVQAHLRLDIDKETDAIHFIRDNTDPFVLTKPYILKHTEPYAMRGYLLTIVSARKVASSQVEVDALKYNDGTSMILVSAEDYRFDNFANGESLDQIIERLDQPGMIFSSGRPKCIYFPRYNTAANLVGMVKNVGANMKDFEFTTGIDCFSVDGQLNVFMAAAPYWSIRHIYEMVRQYDQPIPEVKITYKLVEIFAENDDKIGLDFQSWKNNEGADFFSVGGQYRNNWANTFAGGVAATGNSHTEYYNFNPKWNSKYLDFLTSKGKARTITSGTLVAQNRITTGFELKSGLFYDDTSVKIPNDSLGTLPPAGSVAVPQPIPSTMEIQHGNKAETKVADGFLFSLKLTPVVTQKGAAIAIDMANTSLIGWNSDGTPRLAKSDYTTNFQVGYEGKNFVVGGIQKVDVSSSVAGLPLLKDLPVLGWLFSTESESVKKSQLVLVATAEYSNPVAPIAPEIQENIGKIVEKCLDDQMVQPLGFQQVGFDGDRFQ